MTRTTTLLVLSLLLAVPALAQDQGPVLVIHDVADLTLRRADFVPPNLELKPAGAEISEDRPMFGIVHEGDSPLGGVEEIYELVRQNVRSEAWETDEIGLYPIGNHKLVVVANRALQARVREFLSGLRRSLLRQVTVEARVLEFDPGALPPEPGNLDVDAARALLARAERGEGVRIVRSARITGQDGQRFVCFRGRQRAFVQDYDVEVAKDRAAIADPIVGAVLTGFVLDVRPAVGAGGIRLDVRVQLASLRSPIAMVNATVGVVQAPDLAYQQVAGSPCVPAGGSALIVARDPGMVGSRAVLLTASVETPPLPRGAPRPGVDLGVAAGGGDPELRLYRVGDLVRVIQGENLPKLELVPSGGFGFGLFEGEDDEFTPYEGDWIADFLRENLAPEGWDYGGTDVFSRHETLLVRQTPPVHAAIERVLRELRAVGRRTVNVELSLSDRRALVTAADGQRTGLEDTAQTSYVNDYDVEIADGSTIADPIVWPLRTGAVVRVTPTVAAEGGLVVLEIQATTARLAGEMESFETPVGTIQLPAIEQQKVWTTVIVPAGETAVVGGVLDPDDPDGWLLRVTPRVRSAGDR